MGALSIVLSAYREWAGLGPTTGMNDIYAWGIWKTFNTMVLTGLGSGGFSIGIAAWIFSRRELHCVMRTAVLTSFVAYFSGLVALGVDVGRPWNFYQVLMPWRWNPHSPLMEVAFCMPLYACVPLFLENTPPLIERWYYTWPAFRPFMMKYLVPADPGDLPVCDRVGLCAADDAPIVARRPDAAGRVAGTRPLADAVSASSLCLGGGISRLRVRDRRSHGVLPFLEAPPGHAHSRSAGADHVVAGSQLERFSLSGYRSCAARSAPLSLSTVSACCSGWKPCSWRFHRCTCSGATIAAFRAGCSWPTF